MLSGTIDLMNVNLSDAGWLSFVYKSKLRMWTRRYARPLAVDFYTSGYYPRRYRIANRQGLEVRLAAKDATYDACLAAATESSLLRTSPEDLGQSFSARNRHEHRNKPMKRN